MVGALTAAVPDVLSPRIPVPACSVNVVTEFSEFVALEADWNHAVERSGIAHPFLRHEWLRTWWECFGGGCRLHLVVVRTDGRIAAIAPLLCDTTHSYGMSFRRVRLLQNDHTPRADFIIAEQPDVCYRAIWNALFERRDLWDVLQLNQIPEGSPTLDRMSSLAAARGCLTGLWQSDDAPYLQLAGNWDEYYDGLSAKFRQNLRNRLSRLTRIGEPVFETVCDAAALPSALEDAFRLEASGWKAQEGTAIDADPAVRRFYETLARRAAEQGWLRLLFLSANGNRLAAAYGAAYENTLFLIKTGYDPAYAQCSPFKLLTYYAVKNAYAEGLTTLDFLGAAEPWKLEWTPTAGGHRWLFVFGDTHKARLLHRAKFRVAPALKRWSA